MTIGTGFAPFDAIKKYLSEKPLRIRVAEDLDAIENVNRLAAQWEKERPRGADAHESIDTPAYAAIIKMRYRAIRPLLLILRRKPDHWFYALNQITGHNPVPPQSEGRLNEMADAWINWGRERGYIRDLD
jgi:hypothetical protein